MLTEKSPSPSRERPFRAFARGPLLRRAGLILNTDGQDRTLFAGDVTILKK